MGNVCECQKAEIVNEVSLAAPVVTKGSKGKGATGSSSSGQKASGSKAASSNSSTVVPQLTEDDLDTEDEKDDDVVEEMPQPSEAYMSRAKNRQSVSAEAYGEWNKRKKFVAPVYPKTAEQKERITKVIESSFLFS
ncbi:cAMP-dependent protein kinase regulatory subunit, partial [Toxoplasma gondii TgCatPRC2]